MNRWELLRKSIQDLIQKYELKIYALEDSVSDCEKIKSFLDSYNKQNYDIEFLLNISKNSAFSDEVKNLIELIKTEIFIKNYAFLEKQYGEIHAEIEKYIQKLQAKYQLININNSRNNTYKEEYAFYTEIYSIIGDKGLQKVCSLEVLNFLIDKVQMLNIEAEEKELLIFEISKSNALLMKQNIDLEVRKNNSIKESTRIIETEKKENNINNIDYIAYIDSAKKIIEETPLSNNEEITLISLKLNSCKDFDDRKKLYSSIDDFSVCKSIIVLDLKNNILKNINSENYKLLISIIDFYNEVCKKEKLINDVDSKSIYDLLSNDNFSKQLNLLKESEKVLEIYDIFLKNCYKYDISNSELELIKIQRDYKNLADDINLFKTVTKSYFKNAKNDDEEFNFGYECLLEKYSIAIEQIDLIKNIMTEKNVSGEEQQIDDNIENKLLNKDNKSILIFISNNDSDISTLEEELLKDKDRRYESFNAVKNGLNYLMKTGEMSAEDHRAKSDNYTEEFIKKYRIKGYKYNNYRILTTRRNTCIGKVLNDFPENMFVNIIFSAGYGDCAGNQKEAVYDAGFKACYDNKSKVDEILRLINIKWDEINDKSKKQEEASKLKKVIESSQKMYDHFLNTCKEIDESRKGYKNE